jgi:hypothetical protein
MLRIAAALSVAFGAAALLAFLHVLGEGPFASPEARHLRAMKDRVAVPLEITPTSLPAMVALPHARPLAEYAALERRGVSLDGYVQHLLRASDGDLHLELVARPVAPTGWDTTYVTAEITPGIRRLAPGWSYATLVERFHPRLGGVTAWADSTRRVRISGWLLYDWQYDRPALPGRPGAERLTGWEIHPVTRIEVWNAARSRFEDLPR